MSRGEASSEKAMDNYEGALETAETPTAQDRFVKMAKQYLTPTHLGVATVGIALSLALHWLAAAAGDGSLRNRFPPGSLSVFT